MVFSIEQFASALCLAHSTHQRQGDVPAQCFYMIENTDDIFELICCFRIIFEKELLSVIDSIDADIDESNGWESFMKIALSSFLKLPVGASYFHFLLLCSLAMKISCDYYQDFRCFKYAKITSQCFIVVYNRFYKDFFEESEFVAFCERALDSFNPEKGGMTSDVRQGIQSLFATLKYVDDKIFSFTDSEKKIFDDILYDPEEESKIDLCESCLSSRDITDIDETMNCLDLDADEDDSYNVTEECEICVGNSCTKYLLPYRK